MNGRVLAGELTKMRRLRVLPVASLMVAGVALVAGQEVLAEGFAAARDDPAGRPWHRLLGGWALAVTLVSPLLLAVLASRQVDVEHQGGGWLSARTAGVPPGALCRGKLVLLGGLVGLVTLLQGLLVLAVGRLAGVGVALPAGLWWGWSGRVLVVHLVLLAGHLLLAARVENQLVGLGAALLGTFAAVSGPALPSWLAHLHPWGYYALTTPVDYVDGVLLTLDPPYPSLALLLVVGAGVFTVLTRVLDRQEV